MVVVVVVVITRCKLAARLLPYLLFAKTAVDSRRLVSDPDSVDLDECTWVRLRNVEPPAESRPSAEEDILLWVPAADENTLGTTILLRRFSLMTALSNASPLKPSQLCLWF